MRFCVLQHNALVVECEVTDASSNKRKKDAFADVVGEEEKDDMMLGFAAVKSWLQSDVGLPQYFLTFVENEYDSLEDIAAIQHQKCLVAIGVDNAAHQTKLMADIERLKQRLLQSSGMMKVLTYKPEVLVDVKSSDIIRGMCSCLVIPELIASDVPNLSRMLDPHTVYHGVFGHDPRSHSLILREKLDDTECFYMLFRSAHSFERDTDSTVYQFCGREYGVIAANWNGLYQLRLEDVHDSKPWGMLTNPAQKKPCMKSC